MKTTENLWRVVGTSPNGNPVRMTVRAADYAEARSKARKAKVTIRDLVLVDLNHGEKS